MTDGARPARERTLAGQVARILGEVTADLRTAVEWEASGGTLGWPETPPEAQALPELVLPAAAPAPAKPPARSPQRGASRPPASAPASARATAPPAQAGPPAAVAPEAVAAARDLDELRAVIGDCRLCKLCGERHHLVFGQGNPHAELMLVGEGPGYHEDREGLAFVGPAGELLTKILAAIGLTRDDVYICNVVKCRPPRNRDPEDDELAACRAFVDRQIELVGPKVILALGRIAGRALLGRPGASLASLRGFHDVRGVPVMVTYHPAALLREPALKRPVWEDVQQVKSRLSS